jgi:capsular polysaccharide biosynthesis protein
VPTAPVARAVVERLNLPKGSAGEVVENTSAEQVPGTTRINVTYEDSESKRAQLVANAIGQVVSQKISEVRLGPNRLTATVREPATLPQAPVSPKPLRNGLIALVASLAVALSVVLVASRYRSR